MTAVVVDFHALLRAVVDKIGKYKIYKALNHDKNTPDRWLTGGQPDDPRDIGGLVRLALLNGIDVSKYQTFTSIYDFSPELSFEDNMFAGPPELRWLWDRQGPDSSNVDFEWAIATNVQFRHGRAYFLW